LVLARLQMPEFTLLRYDTGRGALHMSAVIAVKDIVEALDMTGDEVMHYLNPDTGEIRTVTSEEEILLENDEEDLLEWQQEMIASVREVLESDRWLPLPDRFEINEWSTMERFAL